MARWFGRALGGTMVGGAMALLLFGKKPTRFELPDGHHTSITDRTVVTFWEKWSRQEAEALRTLVDQYNLTQGAADHIYVNYLQVSQPNQKVLISVAGGDPPDIAGLWAAQIGPFAAKGAILPLDDLVAAGVIVPTTPGHAGTYKPYVWNVCAPGGHLFAIASTPETCALFYNKDLFAAAGMDPDRGPQSIAELDAWADKLTVRDARGNLVRAGFLPTEPGWWDYDWGIYFAAQVYDARHDTFTINSRQQIAAFTWYQNYARKLGSDQVKSFRSGFGQFNSAQNAFLNGEVAMEIQGPFFANFIHWNKPAMEGHYGVVPFPTSFGQPGDAVLGDLDAWVIPRGAKHPAEARKVLLYFSRQDNMEKLCTAHSKASPLTKVSESFLKNHPNPFIRVFDQTMRSENVTSMPPSPSWERVQAEMNRAAERIWNLSAGGDVKATLDDRQRVVDTIIAEAHDLERRRSESHIDMDERP